MHTHTCIKCSTSYQSEDPEPYYCDRCAQTRAAIAAEIDAKFANRVTEKTPSELELYDQQQKVHGFVRA